MQKSLNKIIKINYSKSQILFAAIIYFKPFIEIWLNYSNRDVVLQVINSINT